MNIDKEPYNDSGISFKTAFRSIQKYGFCDETVWKYDISNYNKQPSLESYKYANIVNWKFECYVVGRDLNIIKHILANEYPILLGASIFKSFFSDNTMPNADTDEYLGCHSFIIVGYDDFNEKFKVQSTWGYELQPFNQS